MTLSRLAFGAEAAEKKSSVEEALSKIASLGPGVHAIKKDSKGQIISCMVVGQARISTVLGKAKGIEIARDKANLSASAEFVKWLKEEVSVGQTNKEGDVTLIEGTKGPDGDSQKESGKADEQSRKIMDSTAKGLVRGLQVIHKEIGGDATTYTVVKGWKADTVDATKKVAADLASDTPATSNVERLGTIVNEVKKIDNEIKSSSATSDDAKDFLP